MLSESLGLLASILGVCNGSGDVYSPLAFLVLSLEEWTLYSIRLNYED